MNKFPLNNDKSPAVTDWKNYNGTTNTPLQGVLIPDGYIVIDLDFYKNDNLLEELKSLNLDFENALIQTTARGGKHYCFKTNAIMRQGSNINNIIGFDTRVANKGYIATGNGYTAYKDDFFTSEQPELSKEVIKLLSISNSRVIDNNSISNADIPCTNQDDTPYTKEQIREIIFSLPEHIGSDNSSWFTVCAGLKRQIIASDMGLSTIDRKTHWGYRLLDEWSKSRDGYSDEVERNNWKRWKSIDNNSNNAITFASVLALSNSNKSDNKDSKEDYIINNYCIFGSKYRNINTNSDFTKEAFNHLAFDYVPYNEKGKKPLATNYFLGKLKVVVDKEEYVPNGDKFIKNGDAFVINTYKAFTPSNEYKKKAFKLFVDHIKFLIYDEREQELLLYYMAYCLQNKGKLRKWAIILQGCAGCGKSLLIDIYTKVFGENSKSVNANNDLFSNFNSWATGSLFNVVEELKVDGHNKYEIENKLKEYITNNTISITRKGKDPITTKNYTNYIFTSNQKNPLPLQNDRRYCVLFSQWQDKKEVENYIKNFHPDYFKNLEKLLDETDSIHNGLMQLEIPKWFIDQNVAPNTKAKEIVERSGKNEAEVNYLEALNDNLQAIKLEDGAINITGLNKIIQKDILASDLEYPTHRQIKQILLNAGYHIVNRRVINGVKCTIYKQ